jgi:hypothetical protein
VRHLPFTILCLAQEKSSLFRLVMRIGARFPIARNQVQDHSGKSIENVPVKELLFLPVSHQTAVEKEDRR